MFNRFILFLAETSSAIDSTITSGDAIVDTPIVEEAFDFWKYLQNLFTPELIATIMSLLTAVITIFKVVHIVKDLAKTNKGTIDDVINAVSKKMDSDRKLNIEETIAPLVAKMSKIDNTEETLIKVLALMVENSPESRVAILNLLQSIGKVDDKMIEDAKDEIAKQEEEKAKAKEDAIKDLDAMQVEEQPKEENVAGRV